MMFASKDEFDEGDGRDDVAAGGDNEFEAKNAEGRTFVVSGTMTITISNQTCYHRKSTFYFIKTLVHVLSVKNNPIHMLTCN